MSIGYHTKTARRGKFSDLLFWDRFWVRVGPPDRNGCRPWLRCKVRDGGYGRCSMNGKPQWAHRIAWVLINGEIPRGVCVLHTCDNPVCVNPDHLFLGTRKDNANDRDAKGRQAKGPQHGYTTHPEKFAKKLTKDDVIRIRKWYSVKKHTRLELARMFGIRPCTVSKIILRQIWKNI